MPMHHRLRTPIVLAGLLALGCSGGSDLDALQAEWEATYDGLMAPIEDVVPPRHPSVFAAHEDELGALLGLAAHVGNLRSLAQASPPVVTVLPETGGERDLREVIEESLPAGDERLVRGDVILLAELERRVEELRRAIEVQPEPTLASEFEAFAGIRRSVHAIFTDLPLHTSGSHPDFDPLAYEPPRVSGDDPLGAVARWSEISAAAAASGADVAEDVRDEVARRASLEVQLQTTGVRLDGAALRSVHTSSTEGLAPAAGADSVIDALAAEVQAAFTEALALRVEIASLRRALPLVRAEAERLRALEPPPEVVGEAVVELVEAHGGARLWEVLRPVHEDVAPPKADRLRIVRERREEAAAAATVVLDTLEYESRRPAYVNPDHDLWRSEVATAERLADLIAARLSEKEDALAGITERATADAAGLREESIARRVRRTAALTGR